MSGLSWILMSAITAALGTAALLMGMWNQALFLWLVAVNANVWSLRKEMREKASTAGKDLPK